MIDQQIFVSAYRLMYTAKTMAEIYEANRQVCKYVHSTSRGHEAIQLATAFQLLNCDYVSPYYRDDCMMLGMGYEPYDLMLQLLTKAGDSFSGGRSYYSHPNSLNPDRPKIIHQSSATGMQAIPTTGIAQGLQYLESIYSPRLQKGPNDENPLVICSLGDSSITEGEVSEAFQFAVLKKLPVIYLVQDNQWGISVSSSESRTMDAYEYAEGFKGMERMRVDGTDFKKSYKAMGQVIRDVRLNRRPWIVHAKVSLLNHHTSGVRKEFYRSDDDLAKHAKNDPIPKLRHLLLQKGLHEDIILQLEQKVVMQVEQDLKKQ